MVEGTRPDASYWCEYAWLGGDRATPGVRVDVAAGTIAAITTQTERDQVGSAAVHVAGLTIPGLANCHSHAFHRALRGRTQGERGTFWTWRNQMYAVAERLDPDTYFTLARAVYREMVCAGFTVVGEFHYVHHQPDGAPYQDPNAMGRSLTAAAEEAGIRITLLDTCYLAAGIDSAPEGVQVRFSDGDATSWAGRISALVPNANTRIGAAIHSVRAVPPDQLGAVTEWAASTQAPLHVHVSEQRAENQACMAAYGRSPVQLLDEAGAIGSRTSVVHATHLSQDDVDVVGKRSAYACFCPTTERDLGDGAGPSRALHQAGARLTVGSDSHAVIDPFEEMRAVEMDERLHSEERGHWSAAELLTAASGTGHESLGWPDAGRIEVGAPADLVTVDLRSVRTAGTGDGLESLVFAATAADVVHVVSGGHVVDVAPEARMRVARDLASAIAPLWKAP